MIASRVFLLCLLLALPASRVIAAEAKEAASTPDAPAQAEEELLDQEDRDKKTLDGVYIEAVEDFPNTKNHEVGFGVGFYPFKPYYTAFSFTGDYVYYFNKKLAWEVINMGYALTADSSLTTQLAERFGVNPTVIERLNATFSTNLMYAFSHGKLLFLNKYIRYFRAMFIAGGGMLMTSKQSEASLSLGFRMDTYVNDSFSWKIEVRDLITLGGFENFVSVNLATGISF